MFGNFLEENTTMTNPLFVKFSKGKYTKRPAYRFRVFPKIAMKSGTYLVWANIVAHASLYFRRLLVSILDE